MGTRYESWRIETLFDVNFAKIPARIRIPTSLGGDDLQYITVMILNDTGSTLQTVFDYPDLLLLGFEWDGSSIPNYRGFVGWIDVNVATGQIQRPCFEIEMQIVESTGQPLTDWFHELAVITPRNPSIPQSRLSGYEMRNRLFFATPPGNDCLIVAQFKNGIVQGLPTMR